MRRETRFTGSRTRVLKLILITIVFQILYLPLAIADVLIVDQGTDQALRAAINQANANPGPDEIRFTSNVNEVVLEQGQLNISDHLTITTEGHLVTISGNGNSRIFAVDNAPFNNVLVLERLHIRDGRTTSSLTSVESCSEQTGQGGAICVADGFLHLASSIVSDSRTEGDNAAGGGIWSGGTGIFLGGTDVFNNETVGDVASGGGISAEFSGPVECNFSRIRDNQTIGFSSYGGGLAARVVFLNGCVIAGNSTAGIEAGGGGIFAREYVIDAPTVAFRQGSTIADNHTFGSLADGGGIWTGGFRLVQVTISSNSVQGQDSIGGGLFMVLRESFEPGEPEASLINSTLVNNIASDGVGGMVVTDGNSGPNGSAGQDFTLELRSSIIADNQGTPVGNLEVREEFGGEITLVDESNLFGNEPGLSALQDNGCRFNSGGADPTIAGECFLTHAPLPGSPAIDQGVNTLELEFDGRGSGFPRVVGAAPDIGAIESSELIQFFEIEPIEVRQGEMITVTWEALPEGTLCAGLGLPGTSWNESEKPAAGEEAVDTSALDPDTYTVILECENDGLVETAEQILIVLPPLAKLALSAVQLFTFMDEYFIAFDVENIAINGTTAEGVVFFAEVPTDFSLVNGYRLAPQCERRLGDPAEAVCNVDLIPEWECFTDGNVLGCMLDGLPPGGVAGLVVHLAGTGSIELEGSVSADNAEEQITSINVGN